MCSTEKVEITSMSLENSDVKIENYETIVFKEKKKKILTTEKLKILAAVIYGNLFLGSCYALMAPFYPKEAEIKQASATAYGLVFGIYQLVMFASAPIYGKLVIKLSPAFLMKIGMLVSGICNMLFSCLTYAPPGIPFIALSIAVRCVDALGASAFLTASYTTIGNELGEIIGRAMSIVETAFAFGLALGPVIGGVLYGSGGFPLPFITMGGFLIMGTVINFFVFRKSSDGAQPKSASARKLLKNPSFLLDVLIMSSCFSIIAFTEATLEPHIRQFGLTSEMTGVIFLISGIVDALSSPIWGYFAEKLSNAQSLSLFAVVLYIASLLIIGPVPFLPYEPELWIVIIALLLFGFGMAGQIVCSFTHAMKDTVAQGFPDDVGTYGLVSGVLFSCSCFGAFLGPSIGGVLIDHVGYEYATLIMTCQEIVVAIACILRLIFLRYYKPETALQDNACEQQINDTKENKTSTTKELGTKNNTVTKNDVTRKDEDDSRICTINNTGSELKQNNRLSIENDVEINSINVTQRASIDNSMKVISNIEMEKLKNVARRTEDDNIDNVDKESENVVCNSNF